MRDHTYLSNISCADAVEKLRAAMRAAGTGVQTETVDTKAACDRITATAQYAKRCSPHYCACAMDGIALQAEKTYAASETTPVILTEADYIPVDTGDVLPQGCDCVVMVEDLVENPDGTLSVYKASAPWSHVRQVGEDICMGDMILPSYTKITPAYIGALLAGGVQTVEVLCRPRFGIIPTGDEIVPVNAEAKDGDIPEFNSAVFAAMLTSWGAAATVYPIVPDIPAQLQAAVQKAAAECDAVLVLAGSSAGRDDYTAAVLEACGTLLVHGLAIKPGKPAVLGMVGKAPYIGVPGYPVSGILVLTEIVKKILPEFTKSTLPDAETVPVTLARQVTSSLKYTEYLRCRAARVGEEIVAVPMARGAGIVTGFAKASGIIPIPQNSEGLSAGAKAEMQLLRPQAEIENAVCVIGSHDPLIDEIADILLREQTGVPVVSAHTGSMGAILAVRQGEAHLGGIHLLDTETGSYNRSYAETYFPNGGVLLVRGVIRKQGLMVAAGNPLGIRGIADLPKISYVNRQKGSGTRILLDYLLQKEGIAAADIYGYTREEYTHTAVAAAVAAKTADAGLGIYSAAKTYGLCFLPLWDEEYDFLVPADAYHSEKVQKFLAVLRSPALHARLAALGGYETKDAGTIKE